MVQADLRANDLPADLQANLWAAADKLCAHLDAAEYKHIYIARRGHIRHRDAMLALLQGRAP